jgi:hypothetical protein
LYLRRAGLKYVQFIQGGGLVVMTLWRVASIVVLLNLPFGYWRAQAGKFSRQWFLAVHLPVPFVIALRIFSGLGWQFITFPVMIGAFFLGQLLGGLLHDMALKFAGPRVSACLVWDMVTGFRNNRKDED